MFLGFFAVLMSFAPCGVVHSLDSTSEFLSVKVVAEVQVRINEQGRIITKLVPADRVVPGDLVLYTLEVRNTGSRSLEAPTVVQPIPVHMVYVADSAVGPGGDITYSVDGGLSFDRPENLIVPLSQGATRPAVAADYTHIRWRLKSLVKADSVVFVRFRARVK